MSNKPHSRDKRISNAKVEVKKKPINNDEKKSSIVKKIIGSLIKK